MAWTQAEKVRARRIAALAVELRDYSAWTDEHLDRIALLVAQFSDSPLTHSQRARLRILAAELLRRATCTTSAVGDGMAADAE